MIFVHNFFSGRTSQNERRRKKKFFFRIFEREMVYNFYNYSYLAHHRD